MLGARFCDKASFARTADIPPARCREPANSVWRPGTPPVCHPGPLPSRQGAAAPCLNRGIGRASLPKPLHKMRRIPSDDDTLMREERRVWCRRRESNPHSPEDRGILSPVRLPVPPLRHTVYDSQASETGFAVFLTAHIIATAPGECLPFGSLGKGLLTKRERRWRARRPPYQPKTVLRKTLSTEVDLTDRNVRPTKVGAASGAPTDGGWDG